jgi:phosphonate degradation associated HDIG domain protein
MIAARAIDEVVDLFERWGAEHYDEEISQLDHARQTASRAEADGADDAMVAAALLHDVGHLLELAAGHRGPDDGGADPGHEAIGARYLSRLFGPAVTQPVALHVRAKRYRCAVDPGYADALSAGSRASLVRQGGPLGADAVAAFEATAGFGAAVRLRGWDEGGKVEGLVAAPLEHFVPALQRARRRR